MKTSRKLLLLLSVALAGAAFAAAASGPFSAIDQIQRWLKGGVYIGSTATASTANKITKSFAATKIYDFPVLNAHNTASGIMCADSSALTLTGVRFGDACSLGIDQVRVNGQGTILPYVSAADAIIIQACSIGLTDAGTFDMPDASYTVRCFSNQ